jgi:hypothetical protein
VSDRQSQESSGSRLLRTIQAMSISPAKAKEIVTRYWEQSESAHRKDSRWQRQERVSDQIIARYARLAAIAGGGSSLPGIIPGLGTVVAATGGAAMNVAACTKLQMDMCFCLAETFEYDVTAEYARNLALLVAAGATLEKADLEGTVKFASQAGVRLLQRYAKGTALRVAEKLFARVASTLAGKVLEKSLPFGLGVAIGGGTSYARTKRVGRQAKDWFLIDRTLPQEAD